MFAVFNALVFRADAIRDPGRQRTGKVLRLERDADSDRRRGGAEPALPSETFTVVGVVRDVPGFTYAGYSEAGIYVPTRSLPPGRI